VLYAVGTVYRPIQTLVPYVLSRHSTAGRVEAAFVNGSGVPFLPLRFFLSQSQKKEKGADASYLHVVAPGNIRWMKKSTVMAKNLHL
jgi:hypothetical protein